jgi:hypothetical protein
LILHEVYITETLFDWFYRIITKKNQKTKKDKKKRKQLCNLYLSEHRTKLIDDKREEEKVNVYEIKFQSIIIYSRETNSKEIALSLLFFILVLTAYKREEIT